MLVYRLVHPIFILLIPVDIKISIGFDEGHIFIYHIPDFFNHDGIISHFAVFKKQYYDKTDGLNISLKRAIDQDLYLKLYEVGCVQHLDEDLYLYRIHKGGISTNENGDKAFFWHWVAIIDACKRRGLNPENYFIKDFVRRSKNDKLLNTITYLNNKIDLIKKSKWIKLGSKLGLIKNYDKL